jgi:hypothetical protein
LTNSPGYSAAFWLANSAFNVTVPVLWSIWLLTSLRVPLESCLSSPPHRLPNAVGISFGDGERHVDRLDLSNDDELRRGARLHEIADIDEPQAGNAVDRRGDRALGDVQLGGIDLHLVALDHRFQLLNRRAQRIVLLACHRQLVADDRSVAAISRCAFFEVDLIFGLICLSLLKLHLIGPRVDLHQHIPPCMY